MRLPLSFLIMGIFFNHNELSEYKVQRRVQYSFYRIMWLLLEVYDESIRYTVPVIGDGVRSFKPAKFDNLQPLLKVWQPCNLLCNQCAIYTAKHLIAYFLDFR